jgi:hypothetical protein
MDGSVKSLRLHLSSLRDPFHGTGIVATTLVLCGIERRSPEIEVAPSVSSRGKAGGIIAPLQGARFEVLRSCVMEELMQLQRKVEGLDPKGLEAFGVRRSNANSPKPFWNYSKPSLGR